MFDNQLQTHTLTHIQCELSVKDGTPIQELGEISITV